ncbi:MAG TPA: hypothetical protein VGE46_07615 [Bdellovibrio sp.]
MKLFLSLLPCLFVSSVSFATTDAKPSYQCVCFQNVPFEGYIIYVVEKFQGKQSWLTLEAAPTNYDTDAQCNSAILADKTCEELAKL